MATSHTQFGLVLAVALICLLPAISSGEQEGYSYERRREFYPVVRQTNALLTVTHRGLFKALLDGNSATWERTELPSTMSSWGMFATGPRNAPFVCYYVTKWNAILDRREGEDTVPGIYISQDVGTTWHLASRRDDIEKVFVRANGDILGVFHTTRKEGGKTYHGTTLFLSHDCGKSWAEIKRGPIYCVLSDPQYLDRVVLYGHDGIRGVFYRARSSDYADWNRVFVDEWQERYGQTYEELLRACNAIVAGLLLYSNGEPVAVSRFVSLYSQMQKETE